MPQLSISSAPAVGYAGQIAEPGAPRFSRSARAEGANVSAGMPVKRGTNKEKQVEPFEAGDDGQLQDFAGVVVLDTSRASGGIADGDGVAVLRLGSIYMDFSEAVTAGEQVGITLATGALTGIPDGTAAGAITTGIVVLPGLRIAETIAAAGLAVVEVNLFGVQPSAVVGSL